MKTGHFRAILRSVNHLDVVLFWGLPRVPHRLKTPFEKTFVELRGGLRMKYLCSVVQMVVVIWGVTGILKSHRVYLVVGLYGPNLLKHIHVAKEIWLVDPDPRHLVNLTSLLVLVEDRLRSWIIDAKLVGCLSNWISLQNQIQEGLSPLIAYIIVGQLLSASFGDLLGG